MSRVSKKEQAKRFSEIKQSPLKKWKMTDVDRKAQDLWDDYTKYKRIMFKKTNSVHAPWKIIDANKKSEARLEAIRYILSGVPYSEE